MIISVGIKVPLVKLKSAESKEMRSSLQLSILVGIFCADQENKQLIIDF